MGCTAPIQQKKPRLSDGATGYFSEHAKYARLLADSEFGLSLLSVCAVYRKPPRGLLLACPIMNTDGRLERVRGGA